MEDEGIMMATLTQFRRCCLPAFCALTLALSLPSAAHGQAEPIPPAAKSALVQFVDNYERFEFYSCEYTHTKVKATTGEDAVAGKWGPRQPGEQGCPSHAVTSLVKDGKYERFEKIADEESQKIEREGHKSLTKDPKFPGLAFGPGVGFTSQTQLFNGEDSLAFSRTAVKPTGVGTVNLKGHGVPAWSQEGGTQYLHVIYAGGPSSLERMAAASPKPIGVRTAAHRGIECLWLTIHRPDATRIEFALDAARGHIPLCIVRYDAKGAEDKRTEVTEIQQCSKNRWFPMRIVKYFTQGRGFWIVDDYKITKLDVDHRPSRESLMLDLPAGTDILDIEQSNPGKVTPFAILMKNERIHPEDIPRLREVVYRKQKDPLADTALPPKPIVWWKWAVGATGLLLVLGAVVWRIRGRRHPPQVT